MFIRTANKKPKFDIVEEILEDALGALPLSSLLIGYFKQYNQRGFLTKKQLIGLLAKAKQANSSPSSKLATLEVMIKKMPNRIKSELPESTPDFQKDPEVQPILDEILSKFPQHKRALFLQSKYLNNEVIIPQEMQELRQFQKVAAKK
jgi:hypothetical protein